MEDTLASMSLEEKAGQLFVQMRGSRILGLKARLRLHKPENCVAHPSVKEEVVGCEEHLRLAHEAAQRCVTLVKDTRHSLPIDPAKQKRARLVFMQSTPTSKAYQGEPVRDLVVEELERAGFTVDLAPNFHDLEVESGPSPANMAVMTDCGKIEFTGTASDTVFCGKWDTRL